MTQRHKHADLIIAWANGAKIQFQNSCSGGWRDSVNPNWVLHNAYRIKPKPDVVLYGRVDLKESSLLIPGRGPFDNIKYTFDGETGKLKDVEILDQEQ
jgi:hypothetical protein